MAKWVLGVLIASTIWCFPDSCTSNGSATAQIVYIKTETMPEVVGPINPPRQILEFVARNPEFADRAAKSKKIQRLVYDEKLAQTLDRINREGNKIKWTSDRQVWGVDEIWDFPCLSNGELYDDCDGIAIWKMNELMNAGISASVLLLSKGYTETNEGHLVLVVTTDKGDFVLDNRFPDVKRADDLIAFGYLFQYRPASGDDLTGPWVEYKKTRLPPLFVPGNRGPDLIPMCTPKPLPNR